MVQKYKQFLLELFLPWDSSQYCSFTLWKLLYIYCLVAAALKKLNNTHSHCYPQGWSSTRKLNTVLESKAFAVIYLDQCYNLMKASKRLWKYFHLHLIKWYLPKLKASDYKNKFKSPCERLGFKVYLIVAFKQDLSNQFVWIKRVEIRTWFESSSAYSFKKSCNFYASRV